MPRKKQIDKDLLDLGKHLDSKQLLESIQGEFHEIEDPRRNGQVHYQPGISCLLLQPVF